MAFKIPQSMQGPSVDQQQLYHALANILSHDHVGQWGSDHLQESKSLNGSMVEESFPLMAAR